jgi:hypothetical protein
MSLGAKVLDWQTDFIPGRTILDQIEQAAARIRADQSRSGAARGLRG